MLYLVPALADALPEGNITTQQIVTVLVGTILPIIVGLVTKASWSGTLKAILLALFSALSGLGSSFLNIPAGQTWNWQQAVLLAFTTWVIAVATYFGLWKTENKSGNSVAKFTARVLVKDAA